MDEPTTTATSNSSFSLLNYFHRKNRYGSLENECIITDSPGSNTLGPADKQPSKNPFASIFSSISSVIAKKEKRERYSSGQGQPEMVEQVDRRSS